MAAWIPLAMMAASTVFSALGQREHLQRSEDEIASSRGLLYERRRRQSVLHRLEEQEWQAQEDFHRDRLKQERVQHRLMFLSRGVKIDLDDSVSRAVNERYVEQERALLLSRRSTMLNQTRRRMEEEFDFLVGQTELHRASKTVRKKKGFLPLHLGLQLGQDFLRWKG